MEVTQAVFLLDHHPNGCSIDSNAELYFKEEWSTNLCLLAKSDPIGILTSTKGLNMPVG
jgi:hypothetical protein